MKENQRGWWDEDDDDDELLAKKARRVANILGSLPGTRDFKVRWAKENCVQIEQKGISEGKEGRALGGWVRATAISWYRWHFFKQDGKWQADQTFKGHRERWHKENPWFRNPKLDPGLRRTALADQAMDEVSAKFPGHSDGFFERINKRIEELSGGEQPTLRAVDG